MSIFSCLILAGCLLLCQPAFAQDSHSDAIVTGAERTDQYLPLIRHKRVALLVNQSSRIAGTNIVDTLLRRGVRIVKIFSPEHGFRGTADAGEAVANSIDPETRIPVISLYGRQSKPSPAELEDVDVMIYDLQDVGVRFYTYISSLQRYMEAAAEHHKPLIILDRPDPNGFYVDGPVLDTAYRSGVGMQPIPVVYGMTAGEYATMLNGEHWLADQLHCDLTVISCLHYTHSSLYQLPVKPSPNLPNMKAVYLYPSLCLFEGTALSVGRGTDKPFQQFGGPSLPHHLHRFVPHSMPGATDPPHKDQVCYGFDLSGTSREILQQVNFRYQLKWLIKAYRLFPDKPHFFNTYFNKLVGNGILVQQIRAGMSEAAIRQSWQPALERFKKIRQKYLLYP